MSRSYTAVCIAAGRVVEIPDSKVVLPRCGADSKYFADQEAPSGKIEFPEIGNSILDDMSGTANHGSPR